MSEGNIEEIVIIASIILAVGIFVGSRLWMVFKK